MEEREAQAESHSTMVNKMNTENEEEVSKQTTGFNESGGTSWIDNSPETREAQQTRRWIGLGRGLWFDDRTDKGLGWG